MYVLLYYHAYVCIYVDISILYYTIQYKITKYNIGIVLYVCMYVFSIVLCCIVL